MRMLYAFGDLASLRKYVVQLVNTKQDFAVEFREDGGDVTVGENALEPDNYYSFRLIR